MRLSLLSYLRCPITQSCLDIQIISFEEKSVIGVGEKEIHEAILFSSNKCCYPVIDGVPRLLAEAILDYEDFLKQHLENFDTLKKEIFVQYGDIILSAAKSNKRTKESFAKEWSLFNLQSDKTWDADETEMVTRFYEETGHTKEELQKMMVLDAGCGNGKLNLLLANEGISQIATDFSESLVAAHKQNIHPHLHFVQADIQFPIFENNSFELVQCSGVLIHTKNTEESFKKIASLPKDNGTLSVWLYHPRENLLHNLFNQLRKFTSKLSPSLNLTLLSYTIFPISYFVKRLKGNKQNKREMMVDILDWFTPQYRWEHTHEEARNWFEQADYKQVEVSKTSLFGFNMKGVKKPLHNSEPVR